MNFVWTRLKLVVEPTGVLGLAAVFNVSASRRGKRVGVILSGGNADVVKVGGVVQEDGILVVAPPLSHLLTLG